MRELPLAVPQADENMEAHESMSIFLEPGTIWMIVVDTDRYSGNFENELASAMTGTCDGHRGEELAEETRNTNEVLTGRLAKKLTSVHHCEYGDVSMAIRITPGIINDGMGGHSKRTYAQDERGYAAYQSVAIFFKSKPTTEEMEFMEEQARSFAEENPQLQKPFKITAIRLLECTTMPSFEKECSPDQCQQVA